MNDLHLQYYDTEIYQSMREPGFQSVNDHKPYYQLIFNPVNLDKTLFLTKLIDAINKTLKTSNTESQLLIDTNSFDLTLNAQTHYVQPLDNELLSCFGFDGEHMTDDTKVVILSLAALYTIQTQ